MRIFAGALTGLIELIIILVFVGIAAINKILAARREQETTVRRPQRYPMQQADAGMNPMESKDVDQFLDEVLGRGAQARQPVPPVPDKRVVVLRPSRPPSPASAPQPRNPPQVQRPITRPVVPRPARVVGPAGSVPAVPPPEPRARSKFSESVQRDVDQAANATHAAAALQNTGLQSETTRRWAEATDISAMLQSPPDIRRAILIREILGPPVALRKRRV
jgi:hypothetical protein